MYEGISGPCIRRRQVCLPQAVDFAIFRDVAAAIDHADQVQTFALQTVIR